MAYLTELVNLSKEFADAYPIDIYPELMYKMGRPYNCLLVDYHDDYFICLPLRSHINHKNAYMFKNSRRSIKNRSGIDYSKMVIVKDKKYFSKNTVIIDRDEYNEMAQNEEQIVTQALNYLDSYIHHHNSTAILHPKEYERRYLYTTLKYFHELLGLDSK